MQQGTLGGALQTKTATGTAKKWPTQCDPSERECGHKYSAAQPASGALAGSTALPNGLKKSRSRLLIHRGGGAVAVAVGGGVGQQHGVLIAGAPPRNPGTALHRQFACRRRIDMLINVSSPGDTLDKHFISCRERSAGDQIASRCDIWTHLADWQFITRRQHFTRRFPFG